MTEEEGLQDLLAFIKGEGRYCMLGSGIHTYPKRDQNQTKVYNACLELERRGLICRKSEDATCVLFVPVEASDDTWPEYIPG